VTAPAILVVTLTPDELRTIVEGAVSRALAVRTPPPSTALLVDKRELARILAVSPATITRLVQEGGPHTFVGSSPRFDVEAFRAWLAERGRRGTTSKPPSGPIAGVRLLSRALRR
jgi:hypothetical protein